MPALSCCPDRSRLQAFAAGQCDGIETETLFHHFEECESCAGWVEQASRFDTLTDWIRQADTVLQDSERERLDRCVSDILRQSQATASPQALSGFVMFECTHCKKKIKVRDELRGKKVKCPGCQQVIVVPAGLAVGAPQETSPEQTMPPSGPRPQLDQTVPPVEGNDSESSPDPTIDDAPAKSRRPEECDFLAPPQKPDEIGRLGGYRVLKMLGKGGMGLVLQAEDTQLKRKVALKVMLPQLAVSESARKRFIREAQAAAALEHDHIVPIFQVGEDRGVPFIAMPFLKGCALDEHLKKDEPLPVADIVRIGLQAALGLGAAHDAGLIHRDIKPANLWLESVTQSTDAFRVKILDFGLARAADDNSSLTQQGAVIGTPAFMAPEQGRGEVVDHRCDLFSLGCVLYRLCTGKNPFKGADTVSTLMAVALENPPSPNKINADIPAELSDLVEKLLAKKVEDRCQSAMEAVKVLRVLERRLSNDEASGGRPSPDSAVATMVQKTESLRGEKNQGADTLRSPKKPKRWPLIAGGLLALIVAAIAMPQIILRITGKDGKTQDIELKPGDSLQIVQNPGAKNENASYALEFDSKSLITVDLQSKAKIELTKPFTLEAQVTPFLGTRSLSGQIFYCSGKINLHLIQGTFLWTATLGTKSIATSIASKEPAQKSKSVRLALTGDGSLVRLFVDGKLVDSSPLPPALKGAVTSFQIGKEFVGQLGEYRISNNCRYTADYIPSRPEKDANTIALYRCDENSGDKLIDSSGNGHHGNIEGAKWVKGGDTGTPIIASGRYKLEFDANSKVDVPSLTEPPNKDNWTMEGYVVLDEKSPTGRLLGYGNAPRFDYMSAADKLGKKLGAGISYFSTATGNTRQGPYPIPFGRRVHFAAVRNSKTHAAYIDGKKLDEKLSPHQVGMFQIGGGFAGSLEEIRISKIARYEKDFTPPARFAPDADTVALYHCDEGSGAKLIDSSGNGHHGKIDGAKWGKVGGATSKLSDDYALQFDPKSQVTVNLPQGQEIPLRGAYTVDALIDPSSNNSPQIFFDADQMLQLGVIAGSEKSATLFAIAGRSGLIRFEGKFTWVGPTRVSFTSDRKTYRLFAGGKEIASTPIAASISSKFNNISFGPSFAGLIDDIRLSTTCRYTADYTPSRPEDDKDTLALYYCNEGSGDKLVDSSGNGHHGTIEGAKWVRVGGSEPATRYALEFADNSSDTVTMNKLPFDVEKPFTVEGYVTRTSEKNRGTTGVWRGGGMTMVLGTTGWIAALQELPSTKIIQQSTKLSLHQRAHVAVVRSDKEFILFVDGIREQSAPLPKGPIPTEARRILGNALIGRIDLWRISTIARYDKDFTPPVSFSPDPQTLALYQFNEGQGDVLTDSSGNGYHGKIEGAKWVKVGSTESINPPPVPRYALELTDSKQKVTFGKVKAPENNVFTVEGYLHLYSSDVTGSISFFHWKPMGIRQMPRKNMNFSFSKKTTGFKPPVLQTFHFAYVAGPSELKLFLNGVLAEKMDRPPNDSDSAMTIAAASMTGHAFLGRIEQLRLSKSARYSADFTPSRLLGSDPDTLALYRFEEGSGDTVADLSGNGQDAKIEGAKWVKVTDAPPALAPGMPEYALEFDGNGVAKMPQAMLRNDLPFTVEAWIKPQSLKQSQQPVRVNAYSKNGMVFSSTKKKDPVWTSGTNLTDTLTTTTPVVIGNGVRAAYSFDGATLRLFLDGKMIGSLATTKSHFAKLELGTQFIGQISEVRLSSNARYTADYTPGPLESDADTLALYRFEEGIGNTLKDSSGNGNDLQIEGAKWVKIGATAPEPSPNAKAFPLFNGRDLTGFAPTKAWSVDQGALIGGPNTNTATSLRTVAEFSDFELSFRMKYPLTTEVEGKQPRFSFRPSKEQQLGALDFLPDRIMLSGKRGQYANPKGVAPRKDDFNDLLIRCVGLRLKIVINGETLVDADYEGVQKGNFNWHAGEAGGIVLRDIQLIDLSKPGQKPPSDGDSNGTNEKPNTPADPPGVELFNGKDLANFKIVPRAGWSVENGDIVGKQAASKTVLTTEADFSDFDLSFQIQVPEDTTESFEFDFRSGSKIERSQLHFKDKKVTCGPSIMAQGTDGAPLRSDFNDIRVRLVGKQLKIVVNDVTLAEGEYDFGPAGKFAWEGSTAGPVVIRNLRVVDLAKQGLPD